MNVEEFDIEKLIKKDAKSIEIDQSFKAQLKANIIRNNSITQDKVVELNKIKDSRKHDKRRKVHFNRYLKIASCLAVASMLGLKFTLGGGMLANNKLEDNIAEIKVSDKVVINSNIKDYANANTNEEEKGTVAEVESSETTVKTTPVNEKENKKADDNQNIENNQGAENDSKEERNVEMATTKLEDNPKAIENVGKENDFAVNMSNEDANDIDGDILKEEGTFKLAHAESDNKEERISDKEIIDRHAKENNLKLYTGLLMGLVDSRFSAQDNTIFMSIDENSNDMVAKLGNNEKITGIKKVGEKLIVVSQKYGTGKYSVLEITPGTKEIVAICEAAESAVFDSEYKNLAYEKDGNIKIVNVSDKSVVTIKGQGVAWKPDGKYISYVKNISYNNESGNTQNTMVLCAYNLLSGKETYLEKSELMQIGDKGDISRYQYGKHLWSVDNKCIYIVREDNKIISESNVMDRVNVVRLDIEN